MQQAQGKWTVRGWRNKGPHLSMVGRYIRARGRRIRVEVEGWGRVFACDCGTLEVEEEAMVLGWVVV